MKVKIKGFVHWHKYEWDSEPQYAIWRCDMSDNGPEYVCIGEREFETEIPDDFDPRPSQISALRKAKQEILADAQLKVNNIEEQIQSLLCIEHKAAAVE